MKSGGPGFRMGGPMESDLGGDFEGMDGYGSYRRQPFGPDYGGYGQMGGGRYGMGGGRDMEWVVVMVPVCHSR
uniref:Uncharacterized protein n=1 Tax=Acrobeloides nanus TaxID=290746 RepID=A0A914D371_9BILA